MTVTWSNKKRIKFKMADGRHIGKYSKCYNSPTNGPTKTQLGWSHPFISPTCPPWFGCHGNSRWLPTAHCTFRLQQLWVSGGRTRHPILIKFGTQKHVMTTMTVTWSNIKIFKMQNGGGRHVGKYSKCNNSPTNHVWDATWVVTSHHVPDMSTMMWLPW